MYYKANKIKKAIINENKAIASVKAKPKIASLNNSPCNDGFLDTPITKAPKTVPIPTPAPANPIVANPAPKNLADCNKIIIILYKNKISYIVLYKHNYFVLSRKIQIHII